MRAFLRYTWSSTIRTPAERLPGGACTHWKAPPLHGARQIRSFGSVDRLTGLTSLAGLQSQFQYVAKVPQSDLRADSPDHRVGSRGQVSKFVRPVAFLFTS